VKRNEPRRRSEMKFLTVFVGLLLAVGIVGGLALARDGGSSDPPAPGRVDISGPCDEAENLNDARCAGVVVPRDNDAARAPAGGVDISGPCDEAEHANDPRCTGAQAPDGDDRSGPSGSSEHSDGDDSGPGSDDSGHGSDDSGRGSDDDR
jgi:hypothetical protein